MNKKAEAIIVVLSLLFLALAGTVFTGNGTRIFTVHADTQASPTPATNSTLPDFLEHILEAMYPNATAAELNQIRIQWANQLLIDQEHAPNGPLSLERTTPPTISVLSPVNQTYNNSSIPLIFTIDKAVNWTGYSVDGEQKVMITGNDTIANMTNGLHSVTIYAEDTYGNIGASQTINFTVAKPEPPPTINVIAVPTGITVALVISATSILLYRKRQKIVITS